MPLPQQVISQLSKDPETTPGWSSGVLIFSGVLLLVVIIIYFFLTIIYTPHLNANLNDVQNKIATTDQSIASGQEAQLVAFYSQAINLQALLANHVRFSQFLNWLSQNTQANVWYTAFSFSPGNQVTLTGSAKTEADISQQVALWEASPEIKKMAVSNVAVSGQTGLWSFSATLAMNAAIFTTSPIPVPTSTTP